ncbi:MAG: UDP-galactopyranose mutase [Bacteroidales bacterium]|nr:UDP-galactopyranose mutase [Bacteroidales bacterium]
MKPEYDYLIVGSGLYGATFAWCATRAGKRCLVVERRRHTGGNLRCENVEDIVVHRYGAHIFHTSDREVWDTVNSIVPFRSFINSPLARYGDELYNLPFNMNTFCRMWGCTSPAEAQAILNSQREAETARQIAAGHAEPTNLEEQALRLVGRDIYEKLIKGYTEKQWGRPCAELPAFIIRRLPVRLTFDNNYFDDTYQGIPEGGYNRLIDRMLEGSEVWTGCDYACHRGELRPKASAVVYTGAIDEYLGYCHGRLDYRSVRFESEILPVANWQGNAVVNYTAADIPFTRIIEHKHFTMRGDEVHRTPVTVISREYPSEWEDGAERCYPVNDLRNTTLYDRYAAMAVQEHGVIFGGRLAEFRYYDMDDVVAKAIKDFCHAAK